MMKNKKGDLTATVLSVIIAVVGIGLILYGAIQLYNISVNQDSENAKKLLEVIEGKINILKDGETGKFLIKGVEGWFLTGWSVDDSTRPEKCFFKSCICVCLLSFDPRIPYGAPMDYRRKDAKESCQQKGFCRDTDEKSVSVNSKTSVENNMFDTIVFPKNLMELQISKGETLYITEK